MHKEYCYLKPKIWMDETFHRMSPEQKLIMLHFLSSPYSNWCGVYKASTATMAHLIGIEEQSFKQAFKAFLNQYSDLVLHDPETGEIAILNWAQMNLKDAKPNTLKRAYNELLEIESERLILKMIEHTKSSRIKNELYTKALRSIRMTKMNHEKELKKITEEPCLEEKNEKSQDFTMTSPNPLIVNEFPYNKNKVKKSKVNKEFCKVETLPFVKNSEANSTSTKEEDPNLNVKEKEEATTCAAPSFEDQNKQKLWDQLNGKSKKYFPDIVAAIDAFKQITGKKRTTYYNQGYVKSLLYWIKKGYTLEDFEKVFQYKFNKFSGKPDQEEYINISTMCRQELFERNLELANRIAEKVEIGLSKIDQWQHPEPKMKIYEQYRAGYEKTIEHLYKTWPNIWNEIRPFSMDEFTRLFHKEAPHSSKGWHAVYMRKEKFRPWLNGLLNKLNSKKWEREKYLNLGKLSINAIIWHEFSQLDK